MRPAARSPRVLGPIDFGGPGVVVSLYKVPAGVYPLSGSARHTLSYARIGRSVPVCVYDSGHPFVFLAIPLLTRVVEVRRTSR